LKKDLLGENPLVAGCLENNKICAASTLHTRREFARSACSRQQLHTMIVNVTHGNAPIANNGNAIGILAYFCAYVIWPEPLATGLNEPRTNVDHWGKKGDIISVG
jgi:hypothetical protein